MKTKHLTFLCIIALFSVDLAHGKWPSVDPHAENYYPQSPYSYVGNNPIRNVDPNGRDWYSVITTDEEEYVEYVYTEEYRSQKDLTKAGIEGTYLGLTATVDEIYLSLLGHGFATGSKEEQQIAKMAQNLDETIKNYYKETNIHIGYDMYEQMSYSHDMTVPGATVGTTIFSYAGGNVRYHIAKNMSGGILSWGSGEPTQIRTGGYFGTKILGVHSTANRNGANAKFDVFHWTFPNTQTHNAVRRQAERLLRGRQGYYLK